MNEPPRTGSSNTAFWAAVAVALSPNLAIGCGQAVVGEGGGGVQGEYPAGGESPEGGAPPRDNRPMGGRTTLTGGAGGATAAPGGARNVDDAEGGEGGEQPGSGCARESRALSYEPGIEVASKAGLVVTLVGSEPGPFVGNQTWTLSIERDQAPVVGATVRVTPYMPDHGHGSTVTPLVREVGDGVYVAQPIRFIMSGFWQTTVRVTADDWSDSVVVPLCVER